MTSDLESNIVAVERVKEYSETPPEVSIANIAPLSPDFFNFPTPFSIFISEMSLDHGRDDDDHNHSVNMQISQLCHLATSSDHLNLEQMPCEPFRQAF